MRHHPLPLLVRLLPSAATVQQPALHQLRGCRILQPPRSAHGPIEHRVSFGVAEKPLFVRIPAESSL